eukprot:CAMPEP_0202893568 /NCGR_PEP_ID=MMETSP1392-20130828/3129_1 /ASSEMBLY_ACC=CAM_ASM_000868 /TAXON_ID=225041 /ORGANISM="Chlamydomonas chlamydogama, Strain SAG 11-48b" /LENGTH=100 /DNA_ID=CAMNT_0049577945 /DNA_START=34 /DNA_END=333 /DNA_ORIENTATION=+
MRAPWFQQYTDEGLVKVATGLYVILKLNLSTCSSLSHYTISNKAQHCPAPVRALACTIAALPQPVMTVLPELVTTVLPQLVTTVLLQLVMTVLPQLVMTV